MEIGGCINRSGMLKKESLKSAITHLQSLAVIATETLGELMESSDSATTH